MAWLNLNNSINSIKGQITNLATDLLSEGIIQTVDSDENTSDNLRVQELENIVCEQQDEIETLRKQNTDLSKKLRTNNDLNAPKQDLQFGDEWTMFDESEIDYDDGSNYVTTTLVTPSTDDTAEPIEDLPTVLKSKLQDLQNEININNATIDKLNCEIYKNRVDQLNSTETYQRIFELQKKNEHLLEKKCKITTKECAVHERKCKELENTIKNLEDNKGKIEPNTNQDARIQQLESENNKLQVNQDEMSKHFDELYQRNKKLASENEELVANLNQMDQDCQQTTDKLVTLRDTLQVDFNKIRTDYDELSEKNANLEKQLQIVHTQKCELETHLAAYVNIEKQTMDLHKNLKESVERLQHLENENAKLNETLTSVMLNNNELISKNNELQEIQKQYEEYRKEFEIRKSVEPAIVDNKDHEKELADMTTKFENTLTISLRYKNQLNDIFNILNRDLNTKFTLNQPESAHFTSQLNELELNLSEKVNKSETKIQSLEKKLVELVEEKNHTLTEQKNIIDELNSRLKQTTDELKKVTNDLDFYKSECEQLRKNNENLFEDLKLLNQNINLETIPETNEDYFVKLESQLEDAKQQIQELQTSPKHVVVDDHHAELNKMADDDEMKDYLTRIKQVEQMNKDLQNDKIAVEKIFKVTKTECVNVKEQLAQKVKEIENLQEQVKIYEEKLQSGKINETTVKLQLDTLKKELEMKSDDEQNIKKLQQTQENLQEKLLSISNENIKLKNIINTEKFDKECQCNDESASIEFDNQVKFYNEKVNDLIDNIKKLEEAANIEKEENIKYKEFLENTIEEQVQKIQSYINDYEKLKNDFEELMKVVNLKHNENIAYHAEIQRLNNVIIEEKLKNENKNIISSNISEITDELKQKVAQIEELTDKNNFLSEKCDILTKSLLEEQSKCHNLTVTQQNNTEAITNLRKELERLREHLLKTEDVHAQEMLTTEQKKKEMAAQIMEMEQRERDNSTIYTSVNIRVNQQVETLQKQIHLANQQRDEYQARLSESEDKQLKQLAALTNLQCVLEQFQKDKEKEIEEATLLIRKQLLDEQNNKQLLRNEIEVLKSQLAESKQGLKAASRLQEQLEKARHQVCSYKDEVEKLTTKMTTMEKLSNELTSQSENKVDKTLVKNLFLGYMTTSTNPQYNKDINRIVKIIGTVLDFSKTDYEKITQNSGGSWIQSILKPSSHASETSTSNESLSEAFIKFLENESRPKPVPPLLLVSPNSRKNSTDVDPNIQANQATNNTSGQPQPSLLLNDVLLPTFEDFAHTRSSSSILKDVLNNK